MPSPYEPPDKTEDIPCRYNPAWWRNSLFYLETAVAIGRVLFLVTIGLIIAAIVLAAFSGT